MVEAARRVAARASEAGAVLAYRRGELVALALLAGGVAGGAGVERWRVHNPDAAARLEAEPPRVAPVARGRPAEHSGPGDAPHARPARSARDGPRPGRTRLVSTEPPCAPTGRSRGPALRSGPDLASAPVTPSADSPLELNHASPADLARLPGIGPKLAERIVRHREATGGYRSADDLAGVPGLGARRAAALRPLVTIAATPGAAPDVTPDATPGATPDEGRDRSHERAGAERPPVASAAGATGTSPHPTEDERWDHPPRSTRHVSRGSRLGPPDAASNASTGDRR